MNADRAARTPPQRTRPLYWSLRRELWENPSIVVAPAVVALVALLAFFVGTLYLPGRLEALAAAPADVLGESFRFASRLIVATVFVVGFFYSLDALHGERRDRSILFWKSLPVSDRLTVLSKASVPLVVLPLIAFVAIHVVEGAMLALGLAALTVRGLEVEPGWSLVPAVFEPLSLLYELVVMALWHAPIYGWLLLVSGWARRSTLLWAVLPPIGLCIAERIAFGSSSLAPLLTGRFTGYLVRAYRADAPDPVRFIASPGLWVGLAIAAGFLTAAVWLRRHREPI